MNTHTAVPPGLIHTRPDPVSHAIVVISITLLCGALAPARVTAQQIVKWTDEQGQVHFSDHAPPGQTVADVVLQKAPKTTERTNALVANAPSATGNSYSAGPGSGPAQTAPSNESQRAAAAAQAQQRKWEELRRSTAAAKQQADKETVARCKADRETYCDQGADAIRKQQHTIAEIQYADALNRHDELARRGISTPVPREPPNP